MPQLRLRFLGTPEVWEGERLVQFATRKSLALLVYLTVEGGRHSREKLMALLWPESDTRRGQASLRNALARLRRSLGKAEQHLQIEGDLLGVDPTSISLDLLTLEAAVKAGDLPSLQQGVELVRGDFLEGFTLPDAPTFDDWTVIQRTHWHRQMSLALDRLSRLQLDSSDFRGGVESASRWVAHDTLNELAHRRLMEAHLALGNKTAALQAYESCRDILAAELSADPSPETQALAERIHKTKLPIPDIQVQIPGEPSHLRLPFVGRAEEHTHLVTAYHAARQHGAQVVVIEGEAGIGKTRLADEFLVWAAAQGADVLRGRTLETSGRIPYQPWVEVLRPRLEVENAPEDLLDDAWLAELSRLLPELRERYPDLLAPTGDESLARTRLLEAIARLGTALAARTPVVFFLDDLQWADIATLDAVQYATRRWRDDETHILSLLALRAEDLATIPALQSWLINLDREHTLTRLSLGPLTPEDTAQLSQSLPSIPHLSSWLYEETRGQPLFIAETLKMLVDEGDDQMVRSVIAPGIRQMIRSRLNGLSSLGHTLFSAAAVIGRGCGFTTLCRVADVGEGEALLALDELTQRGLLREEKEDLLIPHDKIRDVVYTEAGVSRRRILHRRTFEVLEERHLHQPERRQIAAELALHALAARLPEPAFRYSLAAGEAAMAVFAVRDAAGFYEQAKSQVLHIQSSIAKASYLYTQLGRAYELLGEPESAGEVYREMLTFGQESNQPEAECAALNRLATLAIHAYQFNEAASLLRQAVQVAESSSDRAGRANAEWGLAQLHHHQFDFPNSLNHSERALSLARELDDPTLIAGTLNALAYAQMLLGDLEAGETHMREALDRYADLGNRALEVDCLTALAASECWQGNWKACIEIARAARTISREIENPWGQIYSSSWLAAGLLDGGNYQEALAVAQTGREVARAHSFTPVAIFNLLQLGRVYRMLGRPADALETHLEAHHLLNNDQPGPFNALTPAELCADYALLEDWEAAHASARQAVEHRSYNTLPLVVTPRWLETEALLRGGDEALAREDTRRWGKLVARVPRLRIPHLRSLAVLARWDSDLDGAITHLETGLDAADNMNLPEEQWQILAGLGQLHQAHDNEDAARKAIAHAAEIRTLIMSG